MGMQRFRKRPITIEAVPVDDNHIETLDHLARETNDLTVYNRVINGVHHLDQIERVVIRTREGDMTAYPGQHWIIRGVQGELYPIETEIFFQTYTPVRTNWRDVCDVA